MKHPPAIETPFEAIPTDVLKRHDFFVDIFGRYLLWAIEETRTRSATLIRSPKARTKLGRAISKPYEQAASRLNPEQQRIASELAKEDIQDFAKKLLLILTTQGTTFRLGENHAIQFRLIAAVCDVENMHVVLEQTINRGGPRAFMNYWGRWLNQQSQRSDPPTQAND
jgi:hypothetical protein